MMGGDYLSEYERFIRERMQNGTRGGFDPLWMPDVLFPFQRHLVEWAIRRGRGALFADCGMGKTLMQLVWAENVVRHTMKPVLVLTPLAVGSQTAREASKFGIEAAVSREGKIGSRIVVTNYERLHYFDPSKFGGAVCDEAGILKNFDGKTRDATVEFLRTIPYRLLCTATAAPNDFVELGNSSEALGELGFQDMTTKFFRKETSKDILGWGRTKYAMKTHAERDFWRWVCSWSRACRRPSDLGFDDGDFVLPELRLEQHTVRAGRPPNGFLFDVPAVTLDEQRDERNRTLNQRCERVAELVNGTGRPAVVWCHLNTEGDLLTKLIPDAVQVSGSDTDERKVKAFEDFASGQVRVMVTKPKLAGFGLNWQHCAHQTYFTSHSYEQYYQAVRRCWRFGQKSPVVVDVVTSDGDTRVLNSLREKSARADEMHSRMVVLMNDSLRVERGQEYEKKEEVPSWL